MVKTKVLIVDDSALIAKLLIEIISSDEKFVVVGTATDPFEAREKIKKLRPDVVTLDIEMPRMDGITFLKNIMRLHPVPVVMISTLTKKNAPVTLEALSLGAVDFVSKPISNVSLCMEELAKEICRKIHVASRTNVQALESSSNLIKERRAISSISNKITSYTKASLLEKIDLIAIGASTGGTVALKAVVCDLPKTMPPIVVVQHMPENFTASFAAGVNKITQLTVEEFVCSGKALLPGSIYIANGGSHMKIGRTGSGLKGYIVDASPVNHHRPSVDILFSSIAQWSHDNIIGVLLTGMGSDGVSGLKALRDAGAETVAQDEESSAVWGMPRMAIEQGAASHVLSLSKISRFLVDRCY